VSQILRGKQTGRFAAPPDPKEKRQWWRPIPIYIFLPVTVAFIVIGGTSWLTYQSCSGRDSAFCLSFRLRPITDGGSYTGMLVVAAIFFGIAIVGAVLAPVMLRRWPFWVCWLISASAMVASIVGFLIMSGSIETPFGGLGPLPPPPTMGS
jgi:hypothetical protein